MKHWIQAARLRTLPLSLSGIITGSFLAASKGMFCWDICVLALLTTVGFQILSNFANDYGDGVKGTDNENRIGPQRALQSGAISPKQMLKGIYITIFITLLIALLLIYVSFGKENFTLSITFFFLGLASIGAAIKYTMGKGAYGYSGFGDVFVFLFFGLLGVVGCEFLYTQEVSKLSFLPAVSIGLFSVGVLNLNNMRDRLSDIQSNKNTLAVKLGAKNAKIYHYLLLSVGMLSAIYYVIALGYSFKAYLFLISFVLLLKHIKTVYTNKEAVLLDPELKKVALTTFLFSLLFGIGLLLG
ncbi:1,4-dihydroxy-2-naphthoate octaprenyltransferase [Wenyingzhuangia fucanilytica]|uniref:1,4-dihydroxy-2-naphthoate octaprenyltransferase n=1 Tax=Wenyingzhuangia fucanilytica TaxID=1790137 RepID=A0A1B1Y7E9_9FLAO|nr:1,4-dihydroxy-2-naphthoate octaprenyltransferase [Wenyingzhuangia fucanilytica]ANW96677.1 1,4-dihydroxy-2-naphthoate octaprenyltransferase [Wenyingzhuangia fucanilytica]